MDAGAMDAGAAEPPHPAGGGDRGGSDGCREGGIRHSDGGGDGDCGDGPLLRGGSSGGEEAGGTEEAVRWWVLAVFSAASGLQGLMWMTYSSVPDSSKDYLGCDDAEMNLLLNLGPVAYCLVVPFACALLARPGGLRHSVRVAALMCCAASALRVAPFVALTAAARARHRTALRWTLRVAQFVNAAAAPLTQAAPALLSQEWFAPRRRAAATALARQSNAAGRAVGFFLGPALVRDAGDVPTLLWVEAGLCVATAAAALAHFPAAPAAPPSRSALLLRRQQEKPLERAAWAGGDWARDLAALVRRVGVVAAAFGLQMGVYGAWSGVLTPVLTSGGSSGSGSGSDGEYSDGEAGALGSVNTFAGIFGGVFIGVVADRPGFATRLRQLLLALSAAAAVAFAAFALAVRPYRAFGDAGFAAVAALSVLGGAFRGALDPLFFELATEVGHPSPPGSVGGALTLVVHVVMIVGLSLPSHLLDDGAMTAMAAAMAACCALLLCVPDEYRRRVLDTTPAPDCGAP